MWRSKVLSRRFGLLGAVCAGTALALGAGCGDKPKELPPAPVVLAAVPEPAGLAAELVIPKPGTLWTKVRNLGGDKLSLLPASFPMLVASLLGLPPAAIESLEQDAPAFGAVILEGGKELPVLALHLRNGQKLVAQLTLGSQAKFVKKTDEPSGVVLLEPANGETSLNAALGVIGDFLLVGYAPDGLLKLGPYVARTLPTKALPTDDLVVDARGAALEGPLSALMGSQWKDLREQLLEADKREREKRGSAPSFGDPAAVVRQLDEGVQASLGVMRSLAAAHLTLSLDAAGGHLRAAGTPRPGEGPARKQIAALRLGSPAALLALPDETVLALHRRDDPAGRGNEAADQVGALDKMLGEKLGATGKTKVEELATAWSKGRGDALTAGFLVGRTSSSFVATFPVEDPASVDKAFRGLFDLPKIPAVSEPIKRWLGDVKIGALPPPSETSQGSVKLERKPPPLVVKEGEKDAKAKPKTRPLEITSAAWSIGAKGEPGSFGYGADGKDVVARVGKEGLTLASDAEIKAAIDHLGNDVSTVVLVLPSRLLGGMVMRGMVDPAKIPAAPVVLSLGRSGEDGVLRFDAHPSALREMAKIRQLRLRCRPCSPQANARSCSSRGTRLFRRVTSSIICSRPNPTPKSRWSCATSSSPTSGTTRRGCRRSSARD
jgi:hypothetical protein